MALQLTDMHDYIFILLTPYMDRFSYMSLAKTCKRFYILLNDNIRNREVWEALNLYQYYSVKNIIEIGYRFIRINDEKKVYKLINQKHVITTDIDNESHYSITLHVIEEDRVKIKTITNNFGFDIYKIEYLVKSPTICKIKPLKC